MNTPPQKNQEPQPSPWSRVLNIVAYPFAALAGFYVMDTSIRRSAYKNLARHGIVKDLQIAERDAIRSLVASAPLKPAIDGAHEIHVIHEHYRGEVKEVFAKLNMRNLKDFWKGLHRNQKIEALGMAITVSGVTLGALLTISDHLDRVKTSLTPEKETEDELSR